MKWYKNFAYYNNELFSYFIHQLVCYFITLDKVNIHKIYFKRFNIYPLETWNLVAVESITILESVWTITCERSIWNRQIYRFMGCQYFCYDNWTLSLRFSYNITDGTSSIFANLTDDYSFNGIKSFDAFVFHLNESVGEKIKCLMFYDKPGFAGSDLQYQLKEKCQPFYSDTLMSFFLIFLH